MVSLVLMTLNCSVAMGQPQPIAKDSCTNSIARIYNEGDRYLPKGSLLCPGDRINPKRIGGKVEVLCFLNGRILQLPSGSISDAPDKCRQATPGSKKRCTFQTPQDCPKFKGPGEVGNEPIILSPYGSVLLSQRPVLSWYSVKGATSYKVYVTGYNLDWQLETNNTTLPYPQDQPEFQYGIVYKITVLARKPQQTTSSIPSVVYMLSQSDAQETLEKIKKVKELGLPPDEAALLDLDAVYMEKSLLHQTIETMNERVAAGSQNPTLYRVLGDRYLEAWLPQEAETAYQKAIELAQSSRNARELETAQEHLRVLKETQSQPPTSIKPDQK
ncbi:tetratricopeptide repeat protein [Nostoc sp. LEGE 06077]|uniref:tetratricopeptide repeat protein n=1 Tax=Nostoc sp. LEGE 06077 TaxID=915325 RepID=UPI001880A7E6|nr:tetratricopeptide repeat protein [Nostoc sp. LEGE 06077]MBE9210870.1 tetratricopeptide repeat protein [Nostoc sp. LEGE 06077]